MKNNQYDEIADLYLDNIAELKNELEKYTQTSEETLQNITQDLSRLAQSRNSDIKLPPINLPKFDGTYKSWRSFHDLFKSLIHKNSKLSNVEKLHYLKTSVSGEAETLLKQIELTNENYSIAWDTLEKRFNNKRVLINTYIQNLINQPSIKVESSKALKQLIYQTRECLSELTILGINTKTWDAILLYIISQKLPPETLCLWEKELGGTTEVPEWEKFTSFLEQRFRVLEALQIQTGSNTKKDMHTFFSNTSNCPKCNQNHSLYQCQEFKKKHSS